VTFTRSEDVPTSNRAVPPADRVKAPVANVPGPSTPGESMPPAATVTAPALPAPISVPIPDTVVALDARLPESWSVPSFTVVDPV
jgi:hypothetical protein